MQSRGLTPPTLPLTVCDASGLVYEVAHGEEWISQHNVETLAAVPDPVHTVVDIGAHVGFTTLPAARRGALVFALEPNPFTYATLIRNLQRNKLESNVIPLQLALACADNTLAALQSPRLNCGNTGLCQADAQPIMAWVPTVSPATLFQWLPPVIDYFKMDIEGFEHYVLPCFGADIWQRIRWLHLEIHDIESPEQKRLHASWGKNTALPALLHAQGFVAVAGLPLWQNRQESAACVMS